jgi:hypothetical protein
VDWQTARIFGGVAASLGFYFFCYLLSFICSSQVRGVRYFNVFFSFVMAGFQGLTFLVFASELCEEYGCTFSRAAGFSVAAMASYAIAGISFIFTHDYPGERFDRKAAAVMTYSEPVPQVQNDEVIDEEAYYDEEEVVEDEEEVVVEEVVEEEILEEDVGSGSEETEEIEEEAVPESEITATGTSEGHEITLQQPGQTGGLNPGASS